MYLLIHHRCVKSGPTWIYVYIRLNIDRHGFSQNAKISRINRLLGSMYPPLSESGNLLDHQESRDTFDTLVYQDQPTRILTTHSNLSILFLCTRIRPISLEHRRFSKSSDSRILRAISVQIPFERVGMEFVGYVLHAWDLFLPFHIKMRDRGIYELEGIYM